MVSTYKQARDDPLSEQKTLREFDLAAGAAHGHGVDARRPVDANLQRLLDHQGLRPGDCLIGGEVFLPAGVRLHRATLRGTRLSGQAHAANVHWLPGRRRC